jgi:hypothetical protein
MDDSEATNLLPSTTFADSPIRATPYHLTAAPVGYCLPGQVAAMSAAEGEAAGTAGKRTCAALTAGLHLTAAIRAPGRDGGA